MKITKRQLKRIIKEEKSKILDEGIEDALVAVGGHHPIFHDAALNDALDDYVAKYVSYLEEDIGESRATTMLLEVMKEYLVDGIEAAVAEAKRNSGIRD